MCGLISALNTVDVTMMSRLMCECIKSDLDRTCDDGRSVDARSVNPSTF